MICGINDEFPSESVKNYSGPAFLSAVIFLYPLNYTKYSFCIIEY